jgi:hypothetical protein
MGLSRSIIMNNEMTWLAVGSHQLAAKYKRKKK